MGLTHFGSAEGENKITFRRKDEYPTKGQPIVKEKTKKVWFFKNFNLIFREERKILIKKLTVLKVEFLYLL